MTTTIVKRPIPAARDPANRVTIESMRVAVSELSGTIGSQMQRAVRVCELVDAGILEFKADGTVGRPGGGLPYELDQSLKFVGTGLRILGDLSSSPHVSRLLLQSSVPNGVSAVGVIPNGTATTAALQVYNAQDPDNAGILQVRLDATLAVLHSTKLGSGVARDLSFQFENVEKMRLSTAGFLTIAGGMSSVGSGNPAVPSGFAASVSGAFGGGIRLVDGVLQWGAYTTGDGSGGINLHLGNGTTSSSLTARVLIDNVGNFQARDFTASRGDGTGAIFLNAAKTRYVYFNGSEYQMPGANLAINGGVVGAQLSPSNNNGGYINGNGTGIQFNGHMYYASGTQFDLSADSAAWVRKPRVFVQSGDPGAQAADNDLWAWSGGLKRRSGGAWTTV